MAQTAHLWAIAYDNPLRAEQVRREIIKLGEQHCLTLLDTAVVTRNSDGSVMLDGEPFRGDANIKRNSIANFFARLALIALPLTEAAVGAGRDVPAASRLRLGSTRISSAMFNR